MQNGNQVGTHGRPPADDDLVCLDERPTLYPVDDTPDEQRLRSISTRRKRIAAQLAAARSEERDAILAALAAGTKQVRITAITGFTREYIRRITKPDAADDDRETGT